MQVADRPGDISILTHIFVSDNRTVVKLFGVAVPGTKSASWGCLYIPTPKSQDFKNFKDTQQREF